MSDPIEAAEALIASGRAAEAARDLRARLAAGRGGLLARLTLVKALLAAGDSAGALAEAREAVSLNPDVAVAVLALGEALLAARGACPPPSPNCSGRCGSIPSWRGRAF